MNIYTYAVRKLDVTILHIPRYPSSVLWVFMQLITKYEKISNWSFIEIEDLINIPLTSRCSSGPNATIDGSWVAQGPPGYDKPYTE